LIEANRSQEWRSHYDKARVEVRHLLDGRWRIYCKDQLLLETTPLIVQAPLRIFTAQTSQDGNCEKQENRKRN